MQAVLIVLLCVASAVAYGVVHDQVTARVCVEYFTVGHTPPAWLTTDDPTAVGLVFGVLATWWVGALLGGALAAAARAGRRPKRSVRSLVRPVVFVLAAMAAFATVAGVAGYALGKSRTVLLTAVPGSRLDRELPAEKRPAFQACLFAHDASYFVGFIGGGMQAAAVWASRKRMRLATSP